LVFAFGAACQAPFQAGSDELPRGNIEISREGRSLASFDVELAITRPDQARGLMNRKSMPKDRGMAFLFSTPVQQTFYMLNTLIPLDIAFWDEDLEIIDVMTMTPCTAQPCQTYLPGSEFVGALEVNAGALESRRIRPGDRVALKQ
jgi:uncharacterized protein